MMELFRKAERKNRLTFFLIGLAQLLLLCSCSDDEFENTMQPSRDAINLNSDTLQLSINAFELSNIPSKVTDESLLLGVFNTDTIGKTKGCILMQFASSGTITFPDNISSDSLYMRINFDDIHHSGSEIKLQLTIKKMKQSLNYRTSYSNDMDVSSYVDNEVVLSKTIEIDTTQGYYIDLPLSTLKTEFREKIKNSQGTFESDEEFLKYFPGLYLEAGDESTALISVTSATMYYTYKYENVLGTEIEYSTSFPANKNVRQVNIIEQTPDGTDLGDDFLVMSPGKKSASFTIPVQKIREKLKIKTTTGVAYTEDNKKLAINSAMLKLPVAKIFQKTGAPSYMLLIKKTEYEKFLETTSMPDNVNEILGTFDSDDSTYQFTMKYFIADEMTKESNEDCEFVLVPAEVTMNSANTIIGVVHDAKLHAVLMKKKGENPVTLSVVITGW
ncbi:MAG: DUF4270 family protein [Paludibacteraceae bacterium]|nr:DUF4270 family protein [Paludibacteraceae bacterium]